jgi:hypothetical protein
MSTFAQGVFSECPLDPDLSTVTTVVFVIALLCRGQMLSSLGLFPIPSI